MGGYIGARAGSLSTTTVANVQDVTATDTTPEVTIINNTHEDTDGGREGKVIFKGQQSGGEESTLAEIQGSHDGTADDEKGDLVFKTNDGNDGASPTERLRLDSAGDMLLSSPDPSLTITNTTHEDTDGGRESTIVFKGEQSGGELSTLAEIEASHDGTADDEKGDLIFKTNDGSDGASPTERLRIDSTGKSTFKDDVGIEGETPTLQMADTNVSNNVMDVSYDEFLTLDIDPNNVRGNTGLIIKGDGSERARVSSDGDFMLGMTDASLFSATSGSGTLIEPTGVLTVARETTAKTQPLFILNSTGLDTVYMQIRKNGVTKGTIGQEGGTPYFANTSSGGVRITSSNGQTLFCPCDEVGDFEDNLHEIGASSVRWDDIHATNGTIQTSDENEKQNIASLTSTEITAATAISKLFKTFKWKDRVAEKGDNARTHTGVVAQQVETAMSDAGLDAGNYAFFISTTWWEKDVEVAAVEADEENGIEAADAYTRTEKYFTKDEAPEGATERNRKGIRYPELLAFIGAATEQRLTSIEARLDALEAE